MKELEKYPVNLDGLQVLAKPDARKYAECCALAYRPYPLTDWMLDKYVPTLQFADVWHTNFLCTINNLRRMIVILGKYQSFGNVFPTLITIRIKI